MGNCLLINKHNNKLKYEIIDSWDESSKKRGLSLTTDKKYKGIFIQVAKITSSTDPSIYRTEWPDLKINDNIPSENYFHNQYTYYSTPNNCGMCGGYLYIGRINIGSSIVISSSWSMISDKGVVIGLL